MRCLQPSRSLPQLTECLQSNQGSARLNFVDPCCDAHPQDDGSFEVSKSEFRATRRNIVGNVWNDKWKVVKILTCGDRVTGDRRVPLSSMSS